MGRPRNPNTPEDGFISRRQFLEQGKIAGSDFSVVADQDNSKQLVFETNAPATNTKITVHSPAISSNIDITWPSSSGTLSTGGGGGSAFGIVQPDSGTSPTATTSADTLIVTSSDSTISVTGNAGTKTLDIKMVLSIGNFNNTSTAKGLDLTSGVLSLHAASVTNPGAVSTGTQSLAGAKTFTSLVTITSAVQDHLILNGDTSLSAFIRRSDDQSGLVLSGGSQIFKDPDYLDVDGATLYLVGADSQDPIFSSGYQGDAVLLLGNHVGAEFIIGDASFQELFHFHNDGSANFQDYIHFNDPFSSGDASAFTINTTTQGFLPPRMTTTEKNAIASPPEGLTVYDTTVHKISYFNGTIWAVV